MVPRLIRDYRATNAEVEFSLRNVLTADQGRMLELEEGALDIGFLRMPFNGGPGVEVPPIHKEPFCGGGVCISSSRPKIRCQIK